MLAPTDNLFPDASAIPLEPSHIALPSADAAPEYTVLPLANLTVDTRVQPRTGGVDPDHVRMLVEGFDHLPPVLVARCKDLLLLCDGSHGVAAAEHLGVTHLRGQIEGSIATFGTVCRWGSRTVGLTRLGCSSGTPEPTFDSSRRKVT